MTEHFDVGIIGGGPGGYSVALRAAQLGLSVALVNRETRLGGTCLNRGCIPSKALIGATHAIARLGDARRMGIDARLEGIDFGRLNGFKNDMVTAMTDGLAGLLDARSVTVFRGEAKVVDSHHIVIGRTPDDRNDPGTTRIEAGEIVVATGSRPRPLPGIPFAGALIDSTQALGLARFPKSAVVIGAGAVAVEFASMWRQAGVEVTMLIRHNRVLSHSHRRTASALTRALKDAGIAIVTGSQVTGVQAGNLPAGLINNGDENVGDEGNGDGATVAKTTADPPSSPDAQGVTVRYTSQGEEHKIHADLALAAIGRDPNTDQPWLADLGVELDENGLVKTDDYGRTGVEHVWALGDITAGPALAHRAFEQGIVIAETIAGLDPTPVDGDTVPTVVFSTPEAAGVGLTLEQARERDGIDNARETAYPMMGNARIRMSGLPGSMSIVTGRRAEDPETTVVLGVHMLAPDASDLIAEAEELVGNHVPLSEAARLIHPHPTFSETLGEALLRADGRPLHSR
ncbi:FAD-dependent oxidoreductase [Bifidobacterium sp. ESL0763]|uniref:dihydrolipoyl dehydrogenase family protein n=1 Tax=Bifidobacterium sp. ESL0763 TaxID=2983227 RepID=UPI0023F6BE5C|nr:FAD-dependent oxidoreductase [Bifidobacterium sp. ESL0763]MDF7663709.1 FAD-dependent oxidoreductase [Bifidobacterium sp. ESL0763]